MEGVHPDQLHHAYALVSDTATGRSAFLTWASLHKLDPEKGNLITIEEIIKFGIDDARNLIQRQQQKSEDGERRFFVILTETLTPESQNALLKAFEEPSLETYFFLVIPEWDILIPTLQSRLQKIVLKSSSESGKINAHDFLALTQSDRLDLIKKMTDSKTKEDERWTKRDGIRLLDSIEQRLYESGERNGEVFADIREMRDQLHLSGSSLKMILEYIALTI